MSSPILASSSAVPRRAQIAIALDGGETNSLMVQWAAEMVLSPSDRIALIHSAYGLAPEEARH